MARPNRWGLAAGLLWPLLLGAQTAQDVKGILDRLDRLENENRQLLEEVRALRAELHGAAAAPAPAGQAQTIEERLDVEDRRIDELAQTKVEASQRLPIRLTGMALFNAFLDSRQNGGTDYPTIAAATGPRRGGATLRQTVIGLEFGGSPTVWGGKAHGSVYMDFFTGSTVFTQAMRLRTASVQIDWKNRSVMAGLEKPIFNPREPSSLAQVGISPLTGAGNLWLWLPQARFEQDIAMGRSAGVRARVGAVATREVSAYPGSDTTTNLEAVRPALEGRFEFFRNFDDNRRIEIAPGFHTSTTHVAGLSVPSNLVSLDWFCNPWTRLEFTGAFYSGQNVAHLGTGAIRQGFGLYGGEAEAVHSRGGWGQFTVHAAKRVDVHLFSGQQDDRNGDLERGGIGKNLMYGGNVFIHMASNVLLGLEASQVRTVYIGQGTRLNNHYDLALGYLF